MWSGAGRSRFASAHAGAHSSAGLLKSAAAVLVIGMTVAVILRLGGIERIAHAAGQWTDATVRRVEDAWLNLRGQPDPSTPRSERGREPSAPAAPSSPAPAPLAERPAPMPATPAPAPPPVSTAVGQAPAAPRVSRGPADEARVAPPPPAVPAPPARVASTPVVSAPPRAPTDETPRPAPRETVTPADAQSLPAFTGLVPRVEMSRQTSQSGSGVVYSVRLGDSSGRVLSGAQVWLRGQGDNGQMRETRLDDTERAGVYKSGPLPPDLMPPGGLSVRVFFSNMRIEVPIDH